ncbi:MAG: hypothetical protein KF897_09630 [Opitutaceae bacterium]|nr:hypothetical protein [Opitutaceae bacterium]
MKDTKFIELLNLYLDHQISETDAAALEAEIRQNPARHRLYRQYCQMHKACAQLSAQFTAEAPAPARAASAKPARRLASLYYYGAGLAAAACVAFIVMSRPASAPSGAPALAGTTPAAFPVAAPLPPPAAPTQELRTVFTTQAIAPLEEAANVAPVFVAANSESFDWMNELRLNPVQPTPVVFESTPARVPDREAFRSRRPFEATVEMTAYQFQK